MTEINCRWRSGAQVALRVWHNAHNAPNTRLRNNLNNVSLLDMRESTAAGYLMLLASSSLCSALQPLCDSMEAKRQHFTQRLSSVATCGGVSATAYYHYYQPLLLTGNPKGFAHVNRRKEKKKTSLTLEPSLSWKSRLFCGTMLSYPGSSTTQSYQAPARIWLGKLPVFGRLTWSSQLTDSCSTPPIYIQCRSLILRICFVSMADWWK